MTRDELPKPFLGRAIIEIIEEKVDEYIAEKRGLEKDMHLSKTGFQIVQADAIQDEYERKLSGRAYKIKQGLSVPLKRGKIIEVAPDFGGEKFKANNGDVGYIPQKEDVVWFVTNETYPIDFDRKFHMINDCDIVGYEKNLEHLNKKVDEINIPKGE